MAIAAHIDKPRGLLTSVSVAAHQKRTLEDTFLAAVEIVDLATREKVDGKLGGARPMAFVQGSEYVGYVFEPTCLVRNWRASHMGQGKPCRPDRVSATLWPILNCASG